jgi:hypothetical protein
LIECGAVFCVRVQICGAVLLGLAKHVVTALECAALAIRCDNV